MSYGKPKPVNPAVKFIECRGGEGRFTYYKKSETAGEKGEQIEVPLPIKFVVIDELSTITGFNDDLQAGIYSNEVHNLKKEILSVRTFKGNKGVIGRYDEIKAGIKEMGGKFAKSIYALMITGKEVELVNFKVSGSFLNAWIEAKINIDIYGILIDSFTEKKKGSNKYFEPILQTFTPKDPEATRLLAQEHYNRLSEYFKQRKDYYEQEYETEQVIKEERNDTFDKNGDYKPSDDDLPF